MGDSLNDSTIALWFKTSQDIQAQLTSSQNDSSALKIERDELKLERDAIRVQRDELQAERDTLQAQVKTQGTLILRQHKEHQECSLKLKAFRAETSRLKADLQASGEVWMNRTVELEASLQNEARRNEELALRLQDMRDLVSCTTLAVGLVLIAWSDSQIFRRTPGEDQDSLSRTHDSSYVLQAEISKQREFHLVSPGFEITPTRPQFSPMIGASHAM